MLPSGWVLFQQSKQTERKQSFYDSSSAVKTHFKALIDLFIFFFKWIQTEDIQVSVTCTDT